ncbi:hypothetical protein J6590_013822 [Homalodisca vitripennis]|nr:hypothetical protein J6590_013822 [Homalodisca vitripennis]
MAQFTLWIDLYANRPMRSRDVWRTIVGEGGGRGEGVRAKPRCGLVTTGGPKKQRMSGPKPSLCLILRENTFGSKSNQHGKNDSCQSEFHTGPLSCGTFSLGILVIKAPILDSEKRLKFIDNRRRISFSSDLTELSRKDWPTSQWRDRLSNPNSNTFCFHCRLYE